MIYIEPTAAQVLKIRDEQQIGMYEAKKKIARKTQLLLAIESAETIDDIKIILERVVNLI